MFDFKSANISRDVKGFFTLQNESSQKLANFRMGNFHFCLIFIPLASLNISQDGELVMPAMATPDEFSIECDRSDTDHVCLGKIRDNFAFSENF